MQAEQKNPLTPLLTAKQICEALQIDRSTLWHYEKEKGFPKPVLHGKWRADQVQFWIDGLQS